MSDILPLLEKKLEEANLDKDVLELALKALELCRESLATSAADELDAVVAKIYRDRKKSDGVDA